jgi:hypothetical protein
MSSTRCRGVDVVHSEGFTESHFRAGGAAAQVGGKGMVEAFFLTLPPLPLFVVVCFPSFAHPFVWKTFSFVIFGPSKFGPVPCSIT